MDARWSLAQTSPALGNLEANLAEHLAIADEAVAAGSQLVAFPELSLTGYFLRDMALELALPLDSPALAAVAERSREVSIALGFVERSPEGRIYNSYALFEDGELAGLHRKVHLVTYGMFEESRDLAAGEHFRPIASRHGRIGVLVCEDAWHLGGLYLSFLENCDAILVPSSSPARGVEAGEEGFASTRTWNTLLEAAALFTGTWVLYVNRVGFEDGIGFAGGTRVVAPGGAVEAELEGLDPGRLDVRLDGARQRRARGLTPLRRDEKPWVLAAELARWSERAPGERDPGESEAEEPPR